MTDTPKAALTIRPAEPADDARIIALWTACGLTRPWNDPARDIAFARSSGHAAILVGCDADRIVASIMVGHDGHRGVAYYVTVDPGQRDKGCGRAIMAAAEDWLRARGVWKLNLLVRADNTGAVGFYEAIGFEAQPRVYLEKWLEPAPMAPSPRG